MRKSNTSPDFIQMFGMIYRLPNLVVL